MSSVLVHVNLMQCHKLSGVFCRFPMPSRCWTSQKRAKTSLPTCRTLVSVQIYTQRRISRQVAPVLIAAVILCLFHRSGCDNIFVALQIKGTAGGRDWTEQETLLLLEVRSDSDSDLWDHHLFFFILPFFYFYIIPVLVFPGSWDI